MCMCVPNLAQPPVEANVHLHTMAGNDQHASFLLSSELLHHRTGHWGEIRARMLWILCHLPIGMVEVTKGEDGTTGTAGTEAAVFCRLYAGVRTLGACKLHVEAACCQVPSKCPFARGQKTRHTEASGGHALQGSVYTGVYCSQSVCAFTSRILRMEDGASTVSMPATGTPHTVALLGAHIHTHKHTIRAYRSERC